MTNSPPTTVSSTQGTDASVTAINGAHPAEGNPSVLESVASMDSVTVEQVLASEDPCCQAAAYLRFAQILKFLISGAGTVAATKVTSEIPGYLGTYSVSTTTAEWALPFLRISTFNHITATIFSSLFNGVAGPTGESTV